MKFWPLPDKMTEGDAALAAGAAIDGGASAKPAAKADGEFRRGKGGVHLTTEGQLSWADQMAALYRKRG